LQQPIGLRLEDLHKANVLRLGHIPEVLFLRSTNRRFAAIRDSHLLILVGRIATVRFD
jgi:hypothetical protein